MQQSLYWIGHGSWKFTTANGTVIYVDPYINGNPSCKITMEDTRDADIVCVTHGHDDHIGAGDAIDIAKGADAAFVALPDICMYASKHGIPYDYKGGAVTVGGSIRVADCVIHAVHALHTSDIWGYEYRDHKEILPGSGCCGFVIEPDGGDSVYFAGDTGVFLDMKLISHLYAPKVAVLPIGDKYVMGPREAAVAAELLNADYVVPGHYNTWPPIAQDVNKFKDLVAVRAPRSKVIAINPGETFTF